MKNDRDEHPDGRDCRAILWEVTWSFHALSGNPTLQEPLCVHQLRSSLNPILLGLLVEGGLTLFPAPFPSLDNEGWG